MDVAAPGGDGAVDTKILSTIVRSGGALSDPSGYRALAGTSMAAPYVAGVAEVEVDTVTGEVQVLGVWAAHDVGRAVNPQGVEGQIEGGIVQAASWTLKEEMRWDRNGIATRSWEDYPILKFDEVPEIEVVLIDRPQHPGLGTGECAAGPTAAAIANALHDALGVRARHLPLTPERIAREM